MVCVTYQKILKDGAEEGALLSSNFEDDGVEDFLSKSWHHWTRFGGKVFAIFEQTFPYFGDDDVLYEISKHVFQPPDSMVLTNVLLIDPVELNEYETNGATIRAQIELKMVQGARERAMKAYKDAIARHDSEENAREIALKTQSDALSRLNLY